MDSAYYACRYDFAKKSTSRLANIMADLQRRASRDPRTVQRERAERAAKQQRELELDRIRSKELDEERHRRDNMDAVSR